MNVLIIGGNRFVGYLLAWRLIAQGHQVSLMNRGSIPDPFGGRVTRLVGDRTSADFGRLVGGTEWDAVVDFACFDVADAQAAIDVLTGRCGHYVMISTGQVYLVREPELVPPFREADYAGAVMAGAPTPGDVGDWEYGVKKRAAEDVLAATPEFPSTRLRIPMVNGPRDYYRRIEKYLWRLLDGGPLLLPRALRPCRHVYGQDVATFVAGILGKRQAIGRAYNLCSQESPPLADLVGLLASRLGAETEHREVSDAALAAAGLVVREVSPFSVRWMSHLDPTLAEGELDWRPTPLGQQLDVIVEAFLSNPPAQPAPGYERRGAEIELARSLT